MSADDEPADYPALSGPMALDIDLAGRLNKIRLRPTESLQAVFETIANGVDAVEARGDPKGSVVIRVLRVASPERVTGASLVGFEIEDDGIGFDEGNFDSFKKSDSTYKSNRGGKGVGRLLWLKVFTVAEVESTYREAGRLFHRQFRFSRQDDGIGKHSVQPVGPSERQTPYTLVRLLHPKEDLVKHLDRTPEELALRLTEHFLVYFTVYTGIQFRLIDELEEANFDLNSQLKKAIDNRYRADPITVNAGDFIIHHIQVPQQGGKNLLYLCADKRVVVGEPLSKVIPDLTEAVTHHGHTGALFYHVYVTGRPLDEIVDDERTGFRFPPENALLAEGEITKSALYAKIGERIEEYLSEHLGRLRRQKNSRVEKFVQEQAPQFSPFLKRAAERLGRLSLRASDHDMEIALYETKMEARHELEALVREITRTSRPHQSIQMAHSHLIERFVTEANQFNMSALAEFICARKAVLQVLKAGLGSPDGEDYQYESVIHDIFFPRGQQTDRLPVGPVESHENRVDNLWLIDERLVFHRLLASDTALKQIRGFESNSGQEPDIVIFDPAFVTSENDDLHSVAIIEFKRPGRTQYDAIRNPVQQITDLAVDIRKGRVRDINNSLLAVSKSVLIHGYAICDITDQLKELIINTHDMRETPDQVGYYRYFTNLNLVIEVIPYSKLLLDAERRNTAFFKKLGII